MKTRKRGPVIRISPFVILVPPLLLITGYLPGYAAAFLSIVLHELGHILISRAAGCRIEEVKLTIFGFSAAIDTRDSTRAKAILIYSAGPFFNLLAFAAAGTVQIFDPSKAGLWEMLATTNLTLALLNLLPVFPLDGGRILLGLLSGKLGFRSAGRVTYRLATVLAAVLMLLGCWQIFLTGLNFSLVIVCIYIIIAIQTGRLESAIMSIRQILYRHSKLMKRGIYPVRDLVAIQDALLIETIKNMDFDRFHLIHVLDDHGHLSRTFTEQEVMDALLAYGEEMTFGKLLAVVSK